MSKPTAVQWLIKELKDLGYYTYNLEKLCEQAKQMEKEQISNAYMNSTAQFANDARIDYPKSANDYYNETFGGNNE